MSTRGLSRLSREVVERIFPDDGPAEGCNVLGDSEDTEYGKFAWVLDPEGNKVELWQPPTGQ